MKIRLLLIFAVFCSMTGSGQTYFSGIYKVTRPPTRSDWFGGTVISRTHGRTQSRAIDYLLSKRSDDGSWDGDAELTSVVLAAIETSQERFANLAYSNDTVRIRTFLKQRPSRRGVAEIITNANFIVPDPCGYVQKYCAFSASDAVKNRRKSLFDEYRFLELCQMDDGSFFSTNAVSVRETAVCVLTLNRIAELLWTDDALRGFQTDNPVPDSLAIVDAMWGAGVTSNVANIAKERIKFFKWDIGAHIVNLNLAIRSHDRVAATNAIDKLLASAKAVVAPKFDAIYPEHCRTITNAVENAIQKEEQGQAPRELYFRKWLDALHEDGLF